MVTRLRRWLPRMPMGHANVRRARTRAIAVLAVTAGLAGTALLLAFLFHLGVAAVATAILATVPALYLAWLAVPGVISPPEPGAGQMPARGHPVAQWDLRRLGVHAAISVAGTADGVPPEYVPRDRDGGEFGVRARVAAAARRGGFVLLVGGSSVGKTRSAAEAVKALLPDWWLVHPGTPHEVAALAAAPARRMAVWLDELQHYLDGADGLTATVVQALVNPPHPAVVIGTLWPDLYNRYTAMPTPGGADPHARERQLLDLATVIRIGPVFTSAEHARACAAAGHDPRLRIALGVAGYGLTQTLAAAPQLVARWQDAQTADPYAWAVLTAALDAARLGARAPLSNDFLRAAAQGYLTSQLQAEAPQDWFERALDYAKAKLHGAAAALAPAGAGVGQVAGYTPADYLVQHATRERRSARVPAAIWEAALDRVHDPADSARLAASAANRLLYCYAIPLYRHAADAGDADAAYQLVGLLAERGELDETEQILRRWAATGEPLGSNQLAELLAERGDLDRLADLADAGDGNAAAVLAELLAERGDLEEAEQILRASVDAGNSDVALQLAAVLAERGDLDGLRARADVGDEFAAAVLADLLTERGDPGQAEQVIRARADAGDAGAARSLALSRARLLAERGDLDEAEQIFRTCADAGDRHAAVQLAELLAERGDLDGLRGCADAGDEAAAWQLARLLAERGDLDGLRGRAEAGDEAAAWQLARLLAERGDLDGLRGRAEAGDEAAAWQLARLLAERGDLDGLRGRAEAGDEAAAWQLARLLTQRGDLDGLRRGAEAGDEAAARALAELLAQRGDVDGLRALANAGDGNAASRLPELLIQQGRGEEAERLRRFGLNPDGSIACP